MIYLMVLKRVVRESFYGLDFFIFDYGIYVLLKIFEFIDNGFNFIFINFCVKVLN